MLPNLTNQYISYSMAVFSANEIRTFFSKVEEWRKIQNVKIFLIDFLDELGNFKQKKSEFHSH